MSVSFIDLAIGHAMITHGGRLTQKDMLASALAGVIRDTTKKHKSLNWSKGEDELLVAFHGLLSDADIARELGRSENAVHLRWSRDRGLPSPSKASSVITTNNIAKMLGIDGHIPAHWVDKRLLTGRWMPGKRKIRLVEQITFMVWACSPRNWIYFDPKKVQDPHLKRLLQLEAKRWGNEWWSTRRAADYHGVDAKTILSQIKVGRLPGSMHLTVSRCGRHEHRAWANWFVLRSEIRTLVIPRGKGRPGTSKKFTKAADRWILKAREKLGMTFTAIGRTMKIEKWDYRHRINPIIANRYRQLKKQTRRENKP